MKKANSHISSNGNVMLRKSITIFKDDYEFIKNYANSINKSVSEVIRVLTIKQIEQEQNQELLDFLNNNCSFVSKEEQEEFDKLDIDFEDTSGKKVVFS